MKMYPWPLIQPREPRRLAILRAAPEVIVGLLHYLNDESRRISQTGLPADAEVIAAGYDFERQCFQMILQSEEFEPIGSNVTPPDLWVTFTEQRLSEGKP